MMHAQAFLIGVLQGVLEWLPVSSEGVIFVMLNILGADPRDALSYAIFLHLGTMFASVLRFKGEFASMMRYIVCSVMNLIRRRDGHEEDGVLLRVVFIATAATGMTGVPVLFLLHDLFDYVNSVSGGSASAIITLLIGALLILTGVVIGLSGSAASDHERFRNMEDMRPTEVFFLGIVQGFAILPGVSRSGMTISYLLLRGINQESALRISFIISVPAVLGAVFVESLRHPLPYFSLNAAIMFLTSLAIGYATMDILLKIASSLNFSKFCVFIGMIAIMFAVLMMLY